MGNSCPRAHLLLVLRNTPAAYDGRWNDFCFRWFNGECGHVEPWRWRRRGLAKCRNCHFHVSDIFARLQGTVLRARYSRRLSDDVRLIHLLIHFCQQVLYESRSLIHGRWPAFIWPKGAVDKFFSRLAYSWIGVTYCSIIFFFLFLFIYQVSCLPLFGFSVLPSWLAVLDNT